MDQLETRIAEWRAFVGRRPGVDEGDANELEAHLRDQITDLDAAGLTPDEAFLIAVRRMGRVDDLSREFAREHTGRLWKQLVLSDGDEERTASGLLDALVFAAVAAVAVQAARLTAGFPDETPAWLARNVSLFVLPVLAAFFARRRGIGARQWYVAGATVAAAALVVNVYPFEDGGATEDVVALHLPLVLWFVVAYPYTGADVGSHERRMDFVRFTGEWLIYYALIALGGGVLMGLSAAILEPAGVDPERVMEWVVPMGAAGAVMVAAWLVESKQQVVENMAPVLTAVFTPLFAAMLLVAAVLYTVAGPDGGFDRELVAVIDVLMVVVLGLVLYAMSARNPLEPADWMDRIQLAAVASSLVLDAIVLGAMSARIGDLGLTPNRVAALGLNVLLLVNLGGTAWLSARFLTGRTTFHRVERWQTSYLPAFAVWAAAVVAIVPIAFSFD